MEGKHHDKHERMPGSEPGQGEEEEEEDYLAAKSLQFDLQAPISVQEECALSLPLQSPPKKTTTDALCWGLLLSRQLDSDCVNPISLLD